MRGIPLVVVFLLRFETTRRGFPLLVFFCFFLNDDEGDSLVVVFLLRSELRGGFLPSSSFSFRF